MKLSEEEMIKIYACLACTIKDFTEDIKSTWSCLDIEYDMIHNIEELEKLMMKFYCEIKNEKILDKIDDAIEGIEEYEDD